MAGSGAAAFAAVLIFISTLRWPKPFSLISITARAVLYIIIFVINLLFIGSLVIWIAQNGGFNPVRTGYLSIGLVSFVINVHFIISEIKLYFAPEDT